MSLGFKSRFISIIAQWIFFPPHFCPLLNRQQKHFFLFSFKGSCSISNRPLDKYSASKSNFGQFGTVGRRISRLRICEKVGRESSNQQKNRHKLVLRGWQAGLKTKTSQPFSLFLLSLSLPVRFCIVLLWPDYLDSPKRIAQCASRKAKAPTLSTH